MSKVDLHVHSLFSDGTDSVKEIIAKASKNDVSIISITDHNSLEAYNELNEIEYNGKIIVGTELDCVAYGINFHILGYGCDLSNVDFRNFVCGNNDRLEQVNRKLLDKLVLDYPNLSIADYDNYSYDRTKGGWKLLHYLVEREISRNIWDSFNFYSKYHHNYTCVDFPTLDVVCDYIHRVGGKAVLAHPGKVIPYKSYDYFENFIRKMMIHHLDGIECFYPSHTNSITSICLQYCMEKNLLITCGSDYHGNFEKTMIGELNVSEELLNLKGIV